MTKAVPAVGQSRRDVEQFYTQYGKVMAAWADVESALADWFHRSIQPDHGKDVNAESIFYSARSFQGRSDMLKPAIESQLINDEQRLFVRKAIKRASDYNTFRSKLAHRVTVERQSHGDGKDGTFLQEGDDPFGRNEHLPAISTTHLEAATLHFDALKWIILITDVPRGITPEEGRRLIDRLPKEPHSPADNSLLEELYAA